MLSRNRLALEYAVVVIKWKTDGHWTSKSEGKILLTKQPDGKWGIPIITPNHNESIESAVSRALSGLEHGSQCKKLEGNIEELRPRLLIHSKHQGKMIMLVEPVWKTPVHVIESDLWNWHQFDDGDEPDSVSYPDGYFDLITDAVFCNPFYLSLEGMLIVKYPTSESRKAKRIQNWQMRRMRAAGLI